MSMFLSPLCVDGEGVTVTIDRFAPLKEGRVAQEDVLPGQVLIECSVSSHVMCYCLCKNVDLCRI